MKRNKTTVIGIVCGLACAACVFAYVQSVRDEADAARAEALAQYGGAQVEVWVATRDIAAGETVESSSVEVRSWVADLLPEGALLSAETVVGTTASSTVLSGEVLSDRRFQGTELHIDVPSGLVAVSVPAKEAQAVGGAVAAGSKVDVYATGSSSTDLLASDVLVLATSAGTQDGSSDAEISWITIAVAQESVQEIVSAAQLTELYFALPGTESTEESAA